MTNSTTSSQPPDDHAVRAAASDRHTVADRPQSIQLIRWNDASSETIVVPAPSDGGSQADLDAAIAVGFRILRERHVE